MCIATCMCLFDSNYKIQQEAIGLIQFLDLFWLPLCPDFNVVFISLFLNRNPVY